MLLYGSQYCEADQRLSFRYTDSTISFFLNPKFQASNPLLRLYRPVRVGPGRNPKLLILSRIVDFVTHRLICGVAIVQRLCTRFVSA